MEQQLERQYSLERKQEGIDKLKVFFMGLRPIQSPIIIGERFIGVMAYTQKEAEKKAREMFLISNPVYIILGSENDFEYVENILKHLDLKSLEGKPLVVEKIINPAPAIRLEVKPGKEAFIVGLKMAMSEFIKKETDKKELERIINTILVK